MKPFIPLGVVYRVATQGTRPSQSCGALRKVFSLSYDDAEQLKCGARLPGHLPPRGRDVGMAGRAEQADDRVAEGGQHLGRGATAHLAGVLAEGYVAHVVQAVLERPLPPPKPHE